MKRTPLRGTTTLLVLGLVFLIAAPGCSRPDKRIEGFRRAYVRGDFDQAESEIDLLIAKESRARRALVTSSRGLDESIKVSRKNTFLYLLEKAMVRIAHRDLDSAIDLLRRSRDVMDERLATSMKDFFTVVTDDAARPYRPPDYEHLSLRIVLALADLLLEGKDAYSYALQIGEKQEEIMGISFGENLEGEDGKKVNFNPRKNYQRIAIGAYLEGVIQEMNVNFNSAARAYRRAVEWSGGTPLFQEALKRTTTPGAPAENTGILHVFYFAGRGPRLIQSTSHVTNDALLLAKIGAVVAGAGASVLVQTPVPVPALEIPDRSISALTITLSDGSRSRGEVVFDIFRTADRQLKANMTWIIARAVVRRAVKAAAAAVIQHGVGNKAGSGWGFLAGALFNLASTAVERADTRNWTSLPSQIQAARIEIPAGDQEVDFGFERQSLRIMNGRETFVFILRPDLSRPGVVIVDQFSQVQEETIPAALPEH